MIDGSTVEQRETFMSYMKGWRDGACTVAQRVDFLDSPRRHISKAYAKGYKDGFTARGRAATRFAKSQGYTPSILRCAEPETP